jgi:hypothetical protein
MNYEKLKSAAKTITMPEEAKRRIVKNCKTQLLHSRKEIVMQNKTFVRKPAAVLVTVALCLVLSVAALAATGVLQGYFRDMTNWQGAIVGTSYEEATNEISTDVIVTGSKLTVLATFLEPDKFPYRESEQLGIAEYKIFNAEGKLVKKGSSEKSAPVVNGCASIAIELNDLENGSYKLIVNTFVSEKKADQPLNISGNWEYDFTM